MIYDIHHRMHRSTSSDTSIEIQRVQRLQRVETASGLQLAKPYHLMSVSWEKLHR